MVVINGIKYACERCIRGHRVSGCHHTDVPLRMIKRKGRPPTWSRNKKGNHRGSASSSRSEQEASSLVDAAMSSNSPVEDPESAVSTRDGAKDFPKAKISPAELSELREQSSVTIELPDGTVLGPEGSGKRLQRTHSDLSMQPFSDSYERYPRASLYAHENDDAATPISAEELLASKRFRYQPSVYGQLAGPYNADLYNASTGNNAVAAAINAKGGGGYAPNTGSVSFQPKLVLDNELAVSTNELSDSIPQIPDPRVPKPESPTSAKDNENAESNSEAYSSDSHIPKLSSLY